MDIVKEITSFIIESGVTTPLKSADIREIASTIFKENISYAQVNKIKRRLKEADFPYLKDSKFKDENSEIILDPKLEKSKENLLTYISNNDKYLYYDGLTGYEDFIKEFDIPKSNLPKNPTVILTYIASEFDQEGCTYKDRLNLDKDRLSFLGPIKEMKAQDEEDKLYLIIGIEGYLPDIDATFKDSILSRKQKIYYAEKLEGVIDPKLLKRNYRLKNKKERKK